MAVLNNSELPDIQSFRRAEPAPKVTPPNLPFIKGEGL